MTYYTDERISVRKKTPRKPIDHADSVVHLGGRDLGCMCASFEVGVGLPERMTRGNAQAGEWGEAELTH